MRLVKVVRQYSRLTDIITYVFLHHRRITVTLVLPHAVFAWATPSTLDRPTHASNPAAIVHVVFVVSTLNNGAVDI